MAQKINHPIVPDYENQMQDIEQILTPTLYRLDNLRRIMHHDEWRGFCQKQSVNFHLHQLLLRDPFTKCSFESPTNKSYDPNMMYYLLGLNPAPDIINNPIGAKVYDFVYTSDLAQAIRHRRKHLAAMIDRFSEEASSPIRILSVYSGGILEGGLSNAVRNEGVQMFHTIEQDKRIFQLSKQYPIPNLVPLYGTTNHPELLNNYDFIYSINLLNQFDNLEIKKSINELFDRITGGGYLLLTAFREHVPNTLYRTYFEAFANWFLRYYTDEELIDLFSGIDTNDIEDFQLTTDPFCNIAYILIKKGKHTS